jgi:hypothetical protein
MNFCKITTDKSNTIQVLDFKDKILESEYYEKLCNEIIDILQKQKYNASKVYCCVMVLVIVIVIILVPTDADEIIHVVK